jgi:hypothetical protein
MTPTLVVLFAAAVVFGVSVHGERRPYIPGRLWKMPYKALMFVSVLVAVLMLAHVVTLVTGTPLRSRFGF